MNNEEKQRTKAKIDSEVKILQSAIHNLKVGGDLDLMVMVVIFMIFITNFLLFHSYSNLIYTLSMPYPTLCM